MFRKVKVIIIGAGRVGQVLGYLLQRSSGYQVVALSCRKNAQARHATQFIGGHPEFSTDIFRTAAAGEIVFITTPDDVIKNVFSRLYRQRALRNNAVVIHCSGNFPSDIFRINRRIYPVQTASLHPLQTIAEPRETVRHFRGTVCTYESASPATRRRLVHIIKTIGGKPVMLKASIKPLYHSAGVIASNYLVTLLSVARDFLRTAGFTSAQANTALLPLMEGTLNNIRQLGFPEALTGPISRGDIATTRQHLKMIKLHLPKYLPFYRILGEQTVNLARRKGTLNQGKAQKIHRLFSS